MDKWKQVENASAMEPDEMARQFTELVNDLGYAKTFYPQSRVTDYLNHLASRIYLGIYRNKKEDRSRVGAFFKTELPLLLFKHRRAILYSCCVFLFFCLIAAFSAAHDDQFVRGILGNDYVNMPKKILQRAILSVFIKTAMP
ncbi:MAG: hypothetical protein QM664_01140 [Flavihumibacter sp.]